MIEESRQMLASAEHSPFVLSFDAGPSVRLDKTGRLISRGPGKVTLEDREDISKEPDDAGNRPTVRGARRIHNSLDDLAGRGTIDTRMHTAAIRFLDDCSIASGGGMVGNAMAVRSACGPSQGLSERQTDAITRAAQSWSTVRIEENATVRGAVFGTMTLCELDEWMAARKGTAVKLLKSALGRIADLHDKWDDEAGERRGPNGGYHAGAD